MNDQTEGTPMDLGDLSDETIEPMEPMEAMDEVSLDMGSSSGEGMSMDLSEDIGSDFSADVDASQDPTPQADRRKKAVLGVPIEVVISVGKARPLLSELVGLRRDSVLMLDSKIEDPVEILVGDRVIARGELQEVDSDSGRLCVRLTEVADLSQSL